MIRAWAAEDRCPSLRIRLSLLGSGVAEAHSLMEKGEFNVQIAQPLGKELNRGFGRPDTYGQKEQSEGTASGLANKVKNTFSSIVK